MVTMTHKTYAYIKAWNSFFHKNKMFFYKNWLVARKKNVRVTFVETHKSNLFLHSTKNAVYIHSVQLQRIKNVKSLQFGEKHR